jgi:hypothetical protein
MSKSCNCIAGAMKGLRPVTTLRLPLQTSARRTFRTCPSVATWRNAETRNTQWDGNLRRSEAQCQNSIGARSLPNRPFSSSPPRNALKTIEQVKARNKGGVSFFILDISWTLEASIVASRTLRRTDDFCSRSTSQQQSSSSPRQVASMPTSHTRKSAWRGSG